MILYLVLCRPERGRGARKSAGAVYAYKISKKNNMMIANLTENY